MVGRVHAQGCGAACRMSVPPSAPASCIPRPTALRSTGRQMKLLHWQGLGSAPAPPCCLAREAVTHGWTTGVPANTARLQARAHLCLPGLATLSTAALHPSVLLGQLTEPIPATECHWGVQPMLALAPCTSCPAPAGLAPQTLPARAGRWVQGGPGLPWAVQSVPGTQGLAPGRGLWQTFLSTTAPARTGDLRRAPLRCPSPPTIPPRGFQSAPREAQTTNAEPSSVLPITAQPQRRGTGVLGRQETLSSPPSEAFLGIQVSHKIRRERFFSAPSSSIQPKSGSDQNGRLYSHPQRCSEH